MTTWCFIALLHYCTGYRLQLNRHNESTWIMHLVRSGQWSKNIRTCGSEGGRRTGIFIYWVNKSQSRGVGVNEERKQGNNVTRSVLHLKWLRCGRTLQLLVTHGQCRTAPPPSQSARAFICWLIIWNNIIAFSWYELIWNCTMFS